MKHGLPIAIGVAVFLAVVAGWVYTLPGTLRHFRGSDGIVAEVGAAGRELYEDFLGAGETMGKGLKVIDAAIRTEAQKDAIVSSLKTRIETREKIKAALQTQEDENSGSDTQPQNP